MTPKKASFLIVAVSLFFAAAILLSGYLLADSDQAETVMFMLIALWFVPFIYLSSKTSGRND